ncbi:sulfurtransferase [Candidatus Albibeggiatoa sp. nov. NOAA]|uniref:sulfurtransferase n=1 Tax=Candidatus Albibeggiatoa sp. nov. NOAA TaxID=3162724 RepID=UPI0032FD360D|nr:sulfurtransferase [Thiotrichaceae bacterium]
MLNRFYIYLLLLCAPLSAHSLQITQPLVDTDWLEEHQNDVVILDIRAKVKNYTKIGHIPNAVLIEWKKLRANKQVGDVLLERLVPNKADFATFMESKGVSNDSAVVITSQGKNSSDVTMATRLYWTMKYFGFDNMAILNGGTDKWVADGFPITKEVTIPKQGSFTIKTERMELLATTSDIEQAIVDQNVQLIDTRSLNFYLGLTIKPYVYKKGHIPTAKNFPHDMITYWKAPAVMMDINEIQTSLDALGIDAQKTSIAYCNSGHLATGAWFILSELLNNKNARLYDGSMHEWTKDPSRQTVMMRME